MFTRLCKFTKDLKKYYIIIALLATLGAILGQASPLLTRTVIDELTKLASGSVDSGLVMRLAVLMFILQVITNVLNSLTGYFGDMLHANLKSQLSQRYYEKLLSLPQEYFDNNMTGEVINKLTRSIEELTRFVKMLTNSLMPMILSSIISISIIAYYSPVTAILMLALYPSIIYLTRRTSTSWQKYQDKINKYSDLATSRFTEVVGQIKVVRVFRRESSEMKFFGGKMGKIINTTRPQSRLWHRDDFVRNLTVEVIFLGITIALFRQATDGDISVGVLVMLLQLVLAARFPIFGLSFFMDSFQRAKSGAKDYFEVMDIDVPPQIDTGKTLKIDHPEVVFDEVSFRYDEGEDRVLKDVSFTLKPGSKVALIGESGSGKSTIASLIMMLYSASKGKVTVGGQQVSPKNMTSLRSNISVVFQDPALFSGTLRENIAYGKPAATDKEIEKAAKQANAHQFISDFEHGYDTRVGERGLKLSGGQKQRIAIARALLRDAPILILDEATSSLDSRSESLIQSSLEKLMKGRTTLIIAHRLSTIADVDQIITLEGGKIDEIGSPAKLAKSGGIYQQLLQLQAKGPSREELKAFDLHD